MQILLNNTFQLNRFKCFKGNKFHVEPLRFKSISMWFIYHITNDNPTRPAAAIVLQNFIKSTLTMEQHELTDNEFNDNLYAALRYDNAMTTHCNKSIVPFLIDLSSSRKVQLRHNCLRLVDAMLNCNLEYRRIIFPDEPPQILREPTLLKILSQFLIDTDNSMKVKAITTFINLKKSNSRLCKQILDVSINVYSYT